ncbi:MAG: hypothetical protein KKA48_10080, partial [Proteobacteria bacterium]|nr:hypothetical protein [Pseudomonadota bacterium]
MEKFVSALQEGMVLQAVFFQRDTESGKLRVEFQLIGDHLGEGDDDPFRRLAKGQGDRVERGFRQPVVRLADRPED